MTTTEEELIAAGVVRLRARIFALVFGLFGGLLLFLATASLLLRGGENVGENLRLLGNFCPGYDVTWLGAFVGLVYGAVYGALIGYAFAWVYNRFVRPGGA